LVCHGRRSGRHDRRPIGVKRADKFIGGFDQVLADWPLGDEVHHRKENESFVWGLVARESGPELAVLVGPKLGEHLEVLLKHRLHPHSMSFRQLEIDQLYNAVFSSKWVIRRPALAGFVDRLDPLFFRHKAGPITIFVPLIVTGIGTTNDLLFTIQNVAPFPLMENQGY